MYFNARQSIMAGVFIVNFMTTLTFFVSGGKLEKSCAMLKYYS